MTRKIRIIGFSIITIVLFSACFLFFYHQGPTKSLDEKIVASEEQEQDVYSPEEWEAQRIAWDYFQAQQKTLQDPTLPPVEFPKGLNLEHFNKDLFVSEGLRYYSENSTVLREARETIKMVEQRMPEVLALYEEAKAYNENLPELKRERQRQREEWREIQLASEADTATLSELHSEVLEMLRIVEERERLSPDSLDEASVSTSPMSEETSSDRTSMFDPAAFLMGAQTQLTELRSELDEKYFDVVVSQHLTAEEFNTFFPSEDARQSLETRKLEMRQEVSSLMHTLFSEIRGATSEEKSELARQLLSSNFDTDFTNAVINQFFKHKR